MPVVLTRQINKSYIYSNFGRAFIENKFVMDIHEIAKKYQHILSAQTSVQAYISRIFNEEFEVVCEPKKFTRFKVIYSDQEWGSSNYPSVKGYFIDFENVFNELSMPDGYYAEVLLISLDEGPKTIPKNLYPHETRMIATKELIEKSKEKIETLSKISNISQLQNILSSLGLKDISEEMSIGYDYFEKGDYDGAIKSYRKVVEGFRNYFGQKETSDGKKTYRILIDDSESRTEKIIDYLSKTYGLLSNFGEHYGTHAFDDEGIFTNKLVEDLTDYLVKKLTKK